MVSMLLVYLICCSCKQRTVKKKHLHNYPIYEDHECPSTTSHHHYDVDDVRIKAAALKIRPVDYLHKINNKRWAPNRKPGEVTRVGPYKLK